MKELEFPVLSDVQADSQAQLLEIIAQHLEEKDFVYPTFLDALKKRESEYPTGLQTKYGGVAIPHVDVEHVKKNGILTVLLKTPVPFGAMGSAPEDKVDVTCLFVILLSARDNHMKLIVQFMKVIQNKEDLMAIQTCNGSQQTIEKILQKYLGG